MAKLSKSNRYAILWLSHTGEGVDKISAELGVSEKQINEVLETNTQTDTVPKPSAKSLMITHTSGKKLNNVAIMTKDASTIADETRKQAESSQGRNQEKNIFRPNKSK
jgi:hypothetical protein